MQARYVILRVLLEAGEGLVQLTRVTGSDGKPDVLIKLDKTKIESVGRPAIGKFLKKLQVRSVSLYLYILSHLLFASAFPFFCLLSLLFAGYRE